MGLPNNINVVTGDAKIAIKEISIAEWCGIIKATLLRIKPCLKYVSGFQTLSKLLNSAPMTGYGRFATPPKAMPKLEGTDKNQKTRFVAVDTWKLEKINVEPSHEIKQGFLLLTDDGNFAILTLSCFRQEDHYAVCASSLIANSSIGGLKCVMDVNAHEIRTRIEDGSISPYNLLDRLYLLFHGTVADREQRMESLRKACDWLQGICGRIAI
ncbi:MAG: hypothetical protein A2599_03670 [Candidatus Staskawiczbacteria bacterium RIFOXYD1_FULL_39_28]|uniref:Uncharacterized protein n=1 Tax=Candidatus Staskawiczbacteria bacterium RIFOXYC1_FULL_38_18 TaxID=1802229 RepID=A0A1G2JC99_9BACT|nr:MAG: hypothetical protein A2401_01555 [Candidatus Staskawiczbacteria bacterium RIFOXYC1_FULL_38_18]OGZ91536.1 MAG: hypothetical protein A2599_03670 [Candidatus Staskawiczbacteria bacterium RIFOXYD1_FULL_39_28]